MKKTINLFFTVMLLLVLGSCTKENSLQNSFSSLSAENSYSFCPAGTVEMFYGVNSPTATVRITYDAAYTGTVRVRRNNSTGTLVASSSVSLNSDGNAFVTFQLARGKTYHARLLTGGELLCLIDNTFSIPALVVNPEPCVGCYPVPCTTCEPM